MSHRRAFAQAVLLFVASCLGDPAPATAQRLAYQVDTPSGSSFGVVDLSTGALVPASRDEAQVGAVFTSDGQFAVSAVSGGVVVRHMPTGTESTVGVDFRPVLAHPRQPMLFGYADRYDLARLDSRGLARWKPCPATTSALPFDVSLDGRELFVACPSNEIVVLDTDTGTAVRRLAVPTPIRFLAVNAADELVVQRVVPGPSPYEVARLNASNGQELASRSSLVNVARTGSRRQLMEFNASATPGIEGEYRLVDSATLTVSRPLGNYLTLSARVFVSPDGREAVFNTSGYSVYTRSQVRRLDVATGEILSSVVMDLGQRIAVSVTPVPLAPVSPTAIVAGSTVTLSWQLPRESPLATAYRLDLGSAPGASDLGTITLGSDETLRASGVPPGRYYVRVRAVNATGVSAPSTEVLVEVP